MKNEDYQDVFNIVYKGLASQGFKRSTDCTGNCMYRGEIGGRCAAGHLIPDDLYSEAIEGSSFLTPNMMYRDANAYDRIQKHFRKKYKLDLLCDLHSFVEFVKDLQNIHDTSYFPQVMREKLEEIAKERNLTVPN